MSAEGAEVKEGGAGGKSPRKTIKGGNEIKPAKGWGPHRRLYEVAAFTYLPFKRVPPERLSRGGYSPAVSIVAFVFQMASITSHLDSHHRR